jgi:dethiobiotin synthetase
MLGRPERLALVVGAETGVGKTWVSRAVVRRCVRAGVAAAVRKPVQSFTPGAGPTDADLLAEAAGERPDEVCPPHRWLPLAMAPPMAAAALGLPSFTVAELVRELAWPPVRLGLVEAAGGVRSPLAGDGDCVDLAGALAPNVVVLVASAGLGVINAVRLAAACFPPDRLVVFLNRYDQSDELHRASRAWLADRDGFEVLTGAAALVGRLAASRTADVLTPSWRWRRT